MRPLTNYTIIYPYAYYILPYEIECTNVQSFEDNSTKFKFKYLRVFKKTLKDKYKFMCSYLSISEFQRERKKSIILNASSI